MSWVLMFYMSGATIPVQEYKKETECFQVLMRYYNTPHKLNFRCEYKHGREN